MDVFAEESQDKTTLSPMEVIDQVLDSTDGPCISNYSRSSVGNTDAQIMSEQEFSESHHEYPFPQDNKAEHEDVGMDEVDGLSIDSSVSFSGNVKNCELPAVTKKAFESNSGNMAEEISCDLQQSSQEPEAGFSPFEQNSCDGSEVATLALSNPKNLPYACEKCGKGFHEKGHLKYHMRTHSEEKQFVCDICNRGFHFSFNLTKHRRTHTGEKPYSCNFCGKSFSHKNSLNRHVTLHTGFSLHKCKICDLDFTDKHDLRKHLITHTSDGENKCQKCNKEFNDKRGFLIHMQSHVTAFEASAMGKSSVFECDICHRTYTLKSSLNRHMKKHENLTEKEIKSDVESYDSGEHEFNLTDSSRAQEKNWSLHRQEYSRMNHMGFENTTAGKKEIYMKELASDKESSGPHDSDPMMNFETCENQGLDLSIKHMSDFSENKDSVSNMLEQLKNEENETSKDEIALDLSMKSNRFTNDSMIKQEPEPTGLVWDEYSTEQSVLTDDFVLDLSTPKCGTDLSDNFLNSDILPTEDELKYDGYFSETASSSHSLNDDLLDAFYKCKKCPMVFDDRLQMLDHKNMCHRDRLSESHNEKIPIQFTNDTLQGSPSPEQDDRQDETVSTQCPYCEESFGSILVLNRHLLNHFKDKTDFCDFCCRMYADKTKFQDHMMEMHQSDSSYKCALCPETFKYKNEQLIHIKSHKEGKAFVCGHCDKAFPLRYYLESHMRVHFDDKPFKCQICNRGFSHSFNLTKHIRVHTGERPYECPQCKRRFGQKNSLNRHMYLHSGESPFSCHLCKKYFSHKFALQIHLSKIHGIMDSEQSKTLLSSSEESNCVSDVKSCKTESKASYNESSCDENETRARKRFCHGIDDISQRDISSSPCQNGIEGDEMAENSENVAVDLSKDSRKTSLSSISQEDKGTGDCKLTTSEKLLERYDIRHHGDLQTTGSTFLPWQSQGLASFQMSNFPMVTHNMAMSAYLMSSYIQAQQLAILKNQELFFQEGADKPYTGQANFTTNSQSRAKVKEEDCKEYSDKSIYQNPGAEVSEEDGCFEQSSDIDGHVCQECGKIFKKKYYLKSHMRVHTGEKPYRCEICSKTFSYSFNLKKHIRTHTGEQPYECHICHRRFSHINSLNRHAYTHDNTEQSYQCKICNENFPDSTSMRQHILLKHGFSEHKAVEVFSDKIADSISNNTEVEIGAEDTTDEIRSASVIENRRQDGDGSQTDEDYGALPTNYSNVVSCNFDATSAEASKECGDDERATLSDSKEGQADFVKGSSGKANDNQASSLSVCGSVGQEKDNSVNSLKTMAKSETHRSQNELLAVNEFKVISDKDANSGWKPKKGRKPSGGAMNVPIDCPVCGKVFLKKQDLKSHLKVHSDARPFKCDLCPKAFNHKSTLTNHRRIHTGEKPYKCGVCQKEFTFLSSLQRHKPLHLLESPYKCFVCGEVLADKTSLNKHLKSHVQDVKLPEVNMITAAV